MAIRVPLNRELSRSVLPDGIYQVVIEDVEDKVGKDSGIPYMNLTLSVRRNGRPVGGSIWDIVSMSDAAAFKLAQFLDAVGAPEDGEVSSQWFKGKKLWARLYTDVYDGDPRNKVKKFLTEEQAQKVLDTMGEEAEVDFQTDDEPAPAKRGRGRAAKVEVEEMEEEEMPL
jgi:hypothetical protein